MENQARYVTQEQFEGRKQIEDERFARDKRDIAQHEEEMREVRKLTVQMGEMIKRHDAELLGHEERIKNLEAKPGKRWDGLVGNIISLVAGAIIAFIVSQLGMK